MIPLEPADRRTTPEFVAILAAACVCIPILALALFAALARTDEPDAMFFAFCGKRLLAGDRLYLDIWDNKPPGIFWADAMALWLAGGHFTGIVAMCAVAVTGACTMFFLTARKLFGVEVAAVGAVMAAVHLNLFDYHVGSNRPSTFVVLFEMCAMFWYCRSFDRDASSRSNLTMVGACLCCATMFRQTALAATGAIVIHQVFLTASGRATRKGCLAALGAMASGFIVVSLAAAVLVWWTSDLGEAWRAVFASNVAYLTASKQSRLLPQWFGWDDRAMVLAAPGLLAAAAIIDAIARRLFMGPNSRPSFAPAQPPAPLMLLAPWLLLAVYVALVSPRRAMHYYGPVLPPLVMLATFALAVVMRRRAPSSTPRIHVILAVLCLGWLATPALKRQIAAATLVHFRRFGDRAVDRQANIVETIHTHTAPTDRVFFWRYHAELFWRTDRPLAHRYVLDFVTDQWGRHAQPFIDEILADLRTRPPKAMVISPPDLQTIGAPSGDHPYRYGSFVDWLRDGYLTPNPAAAPEVWVRKY